MSKNEQHSLNELHFDKRCDLLECTELFVDDLPFFLRPESQSKILSTQLDENKTWNNNLFNTGNSLSIYFSKVSQ